MADMWSGRQSVSEKQAFNPAGQTSHNQPTNASSFFAQSLADEDESAASVAVSQASRGGGSWAPRPAAWTS